MHTRPATDDFDPGKAGLVRLALTAPPLPSTLIDARSIMTSTESVTAVRVLEMIRHDPVVVAQLLRVANAAHYGSQRTVDSVVRAVDILGPVTVLGVVTGMNVMRGRSTMSPVATACYMRLIRHSIATAHLSSIIHEFAGLTGFTNDTAFTAGLLHDLGKILLVFHEPEHALAVFEEADSVVAHDAGNALEVEQIAFGHDHTEVGEYVARKLDLPDGLVEVIRGHHGSVPAGVHDPSSRLVQVVTAANVAASALGYAFTVVRTRDQCADHPVWGTLPVPDVDALLGELERAAIHRESLVDAPIRPPSSRRAESGLGRPRSAVD